MRIAFFGQKGIPARWGGVEVHVEAIARRLAERGHEVTVYVRRWWEAPGPGERPFPANLTLRRLPSWSGKHADAASHSALAAVDITLRRADVVHVHSIGPALFAWLPRMTGLPVVVTIHARDYERDKWGRAARVALRVGEQLALRTADRTLVVSRQLQRFYAALGHETIYLPNGVDFPDAASSAPLAELGLEAGGYWLFIGRWVPSKRVVELVDGYRRLEKPRPKLVLAGGDPAGGAYVEAVERATGNDADIIRPGLVAGRLKAALFGHAAGFISAASLEGLPIALLEAMAWGRPCLVSDIPEHREALGASGAAVFASMAEPGQVTDALRRFARLDDERHSAMGAAGRDHVAEHYDWESVVDALEGLYAELIKDS